MFDKIVYKKHQQYGLLNRVRQVDVFVRANTDRSFAAPCPSGSILVTPSAKRPGLWQLTFFDDSGTPQYDSQEPSFESCVRYAFGQWRADIDSVSFISFKEVS